MLKAKNVEEYLRLSARGNRWIEVDFSNLELKQFVLNFVKEGFRNKLEENKINIAGEKYSYKAESRLFFGKYKGYQLNLVFKCDPEYIEWCLINGDSFCISEESIIRLENSKVFVYSDLVEYIETESESLSKINLSTFKINEKGLPCSDKVREEKFQFSSIAIEKNQEKLSSKLNPHFVLIGGSWNNSIIQNRKFNKHKVIIIFN